MKAAGKEMTSEATGGQVTESLIAVIKSHSAEECPDPAGKGSLRSLPQLDRRGQRLTRGQQVRGSAVARVTSEGGLGHGGNRREAEQYF